MDTKQTDVKLQINVILTCILGFVTETSKTQFLVIMKNGRCFLTSKTKLGGRCNPALIKKDGLQFVSQLIAWDKFIDERTGTELLDPS